MEAATTDPDLAPLFAAFRKRFGFDIPPGLAELARTRDDYRRSVEMQIASPNRPAIVAKVGVARGASPSPPVALPCVHRGERPIASELCLPCPTGRKAPVDVYACASPGEKSGRCTIAAGKEVANARPCEHCNLRLDPPMDAVWFFRHSSHADEELKYSLRSVDRFAPWLRHLYVLGDRPAWLADSDRVRHVSWETVARPFGFRTPIVNGFCMRVAATAIEGLSDEWLMFSDDYVLLRGLSYADARVDRSFGELADKPPAKTEKNLLYRNFIWRTRETLRELGYPTHHFDVHIPVRLTKRRVLDAFRDFAAYRSEERLGGLTNDVAILNHAMRHEGFQPTLLRQWVDRATWYGSRPKSLAFVREKCEPVRFLNFDDGAYGPEISGYLAERFPAPSSWERGASGAPSAKPLHVHVVQGAGWIIERVANAIACGRTTVSRSPDPAADVNFFVHYRAMKARVPGSLNVAWMTHLDPTDARRREWARIVAQADLCLAMCERTAALCPPEKTRVWAGAPDADFVKPTLRLGVAVMPGPRKGLEKLDAIRGMAGVEIVETGGKRPLSEVPAFMRSIDYLVITSDLEGGPYSVLEAIAAGKPVIAPDVGLCWEYPVIRYDGTAAGLAAVVRKLRMPPDPWAAASRDLEALLRAALAKRDAAAA